MSKSTIPLHSIGVFVFKVGKRHNNGGSITVGIAFWYDKTTKQWRHNGQNYCYHGKFGVIDETCPDIALAVAIDSFSLDDLEVKSTTVELLNYYEPCFGMSWPFPVPNWKWKVSRTDEGDCNIKTSVLEASDSYQEVMRRRRAEVGDGLEDDECKLIVTLNGAPV